MTYPPMCVILSLVGPMGPDMRGRETMDTATGTGVLTLSDAVLVGQVIDAASRGARVRWAVGGDVGVIADGVARCIAHEGGGFWFDGDGDVRDAYLHVSGMSEFWLPVRECMALLADGLMAVES